MTRILLALPLGIAAVLAAQSTDVTGTWVNPDAPFGPWTVKLKQTGSKISGTMQQVGGLPGPSDIFDGTIEGSALTFKCNSPDGAREITFTGTISGDEISLNRTTKFITQESLGGNGLFGSNAAPQFK